MNRGHVVPNRVGGIVSVQMLRGHVVPWNVGGSVSVQMLRGQVVPWNVAIPGAAANAAAAGCACAHHGGHVCTSTVGQSVLGSVHGGGQLPKNVQSPFGHVCPTIVC
jgi:hypothetical protein